MLLRRVAQALVTVLCLQPAARSYAQTASQTSDTVYHLHGFVRNGVTGKPIARALVQSQDKRLATMTDGEGRFAFDISVPPRPGVTDNAQTSSILSNVRPNGAYVFLQTQRPGYLASDQPTMVQLSDSTAATDVVLKLNPSATVTGHIYAPDTDSPSNVRVTLLRRQTDEDGHLIWAQAGSRQTDSHGAFRFTNLHPGEYTVMTAEWAGDQPQPVQRQAAITREYPPVFFGDASNLAAALKLHVHYGDTASAELHLHPAAYYPIRIPVTGPPGAGVNVRFTDYGSFNGFRLAYSDRDQAVTGSLPTGHYTLLISSFGQPQASALVPLNVASAPVTMAAVALSPSGAITVHVHSDFTAASTSSGTGSHRSSSVVSVAAQGNSLQSHLAQVYLRGDDNFGFANSTPAPNGEDALLIQNVQPGRYNVRVQPVQGYVASITSGGVDLAEHPLVVGDNGSADPIDITLSDDSATLTGTLTNGSDPLPILTSILLLPLSSSAHLVQGFAEQDGKFTVVNIAPGSYRVLALSPIVSVSRQLPYRDADAMRRYESKGVTITATAGQQLQTELSVVDSTTIDDL